MTLSPLLIMLLTLILTAQPIAAVDGTAAGVVAMACPGDCDGDERVTVSELVTGVNIALGNRGVESCVNFDDDANGQVSISELVLAVNAALRGCADGLIAVMVEGVCKVPAKMGEQGDSQNLVNCSEGTPVRAFTCRNSSRCLEQDERVVYVGNIGPDGRFLAHIVLRSHIASRLIFQAAVAESEIYRTVFVGPVSNEARRSIVGGAGISLSIVLSPTSEAAVRILAAEGLQKFDAQGVTAVTEAVDRANIETDFAGLTVTEASDFATEIALRDPEVRAVIEEVILDPNAGVLSRWEFRLDGAQSCISFVYSLDLFQRGRALTVAGGQLGSSCSTTCGSALGSVVSCADINEHDGLGNMIAAGEFALVHRLDSNSSWLCSSGCRASTQSILRFVYQGVVAGDGRSVAGDYQAFSEFCRVQDGLGCPRNIMCEIASSALPCSGSFVATRTD